MCFILFMMYVLKNIDRKGSNIDYSIIEEYKTITDNILSQPANTSILMELIAYVRKIEDITLTNLEDKLQTIMDHILLLSNYYLLTNEEINRNNIAFQWYHKIPEILEDNRSMVESKIKEFQDALKGALLIFFQVSTMIFIF